MVHEEHSPRSSRTFSCVGMGSPLFSLGDTPLVTIISLVPVTWCRVEISEGTWKHKLSELPSGMITQRTSLSVRHEVNVTESGLDCLKSF